MVVRKTRSFKVRKRESLLRSLTTWSGEHSAVAFKQNPKLVNFLYLYFRVWSFSWTHISLGSKHFWTDSVFFSGCNLQLQRSPSVARTFSSVLIATSVSKRIKKVFFWWCPLLSSANVCDGSINRNKTHVCPVFLVGIRSQPANHRELITNTTLHICSRQKTMLEVVKFLGTSAMKTELVRRLNLLPLFAPCITWPMMRLALLGLSLMLRTYWVNRSMRGPNWAGHCQSRAKESSQ